MQINLRLDMASLLQESRLELIGAEIVGSMSISTLMVSSPS